MADKLGVHHFPEQGLKWLAHGIAGIITSDGVVDDVELAFLRSAIGFLKNKHEIERLVEWVKNRELPELKQYRDINRHGAFRLYLILAKAAIVDDRFTKTEAQYLKYAGGKLGFSEKFCVDMLRWTQASMESNKRLKELKSMAERLDPEYR